MPQFLQMVVGMVEQAVQVGHGVVGQRPLLVGEQEFARVQFRGVGRQVFQVQPRMLPQQLPDQTAAMAGQIVEHDDDVARQVAKQLSEELDDGRGVGRLAALPVPVEVQPATLRRDGDGGDLIELGPATLGMTQDRRAAAWGPGAGDAGDQRKAGFIEEREVGVQPLRFFLMRGQSLSTQLRMAGSLRSAARRLGFCGVKPSLRSRRER